MINETIFLEDLIHQASYCKGCATNYAAPFEAIYFSEYRHIRHGFVHEGWRQVYQVGGFHATGFRRRDEMACSLLSLLGTNKGSSVGLGYLADLQAAIAAIGMSSQSLEVTKCPFCPMELGTLHATRRWNLGNRRQPFAAQRSDQDTFRGSRPVFPSICA